MYLSFPITEVCGNEICKFRRHAVTWSMRKMFFFNLDRSQNRWMSMNMIFSFFEIFFCFEDKFLFVLLRGFQRYLTSENGTIIDNVKVFKIFVAFHLGHTLRTLTWCDMICCWAQSLPNLPRIVVPIVVSFNLLEHNYVEPFKVHSHDAIFHAIFHAMSRRHMKIFSSANLFKCQTV